MVPCAHTVVVYIDGGGGGEPLINMGLRPLLTHTVVSRSHTVVVCVDGGGGPLIKNGALKVVLQYCFQMN